MFIFFFFFFYLITGITKGHLLFVIGLKVASKGAYK